MLPLSLVSLVSLAILPVCVPGSPAGEGEGEGVEGEGEGEGAEGEGEGDVDVGFDLVARLPGLWAGPVDSQTSLGDFILMSMDHRAVDNTLFARGDFDANNAIRWWLWRGPDGDLLFENGGLFVGLQRQDTCALESVVGDVYRFCHKDQGCDRIDATFTFTGDDALSLRVLVDGQPHFVWNADRTETRPAVAAGFPDVEQQGDPLLPSLAVSASWTGPAPAGADVWIVLSTTACGFAGTGCEVSRSFRLGAQAGSEDATFVVNEVHAGAYFALLLVDNNGNFATTGFPDAGDIVSIPDRPLSVDADTGGTLTINASITR